MQTRIQTQNFSNGRAVRFHLLKKTYKYPKHIHQFAELIIPLENELEICVEGKSEILAPGNAAFVFPFQTHSFNSDKTNHLAILSFSESIIPDFFKQLNGMIGTRSVFTPRESSLKILIERMSENDDFELLDVKGCLYLILSDYVQSAELCQASTGNDLAIKVVNYIKDNLTENITLNGIAKTLNYNPNYLSKCIAERFGINLCTLIANIRADKAKYLLFETDKSGLEICYECGFGSERTFHRQFKAITGKTPSEYRSSLAFRTHINNGVIKYF